LETEAIHAVFGTAAPHLAISSTKGATGHTLGAGGAIEAVYTVQALRTGIIPPTINLHEPDPQCDLDYVPNTARPAANLRVALTNSLGFGGHNATVVLRRVEGAP